MALQTYKPVTPGLRFKSKIEFKVSKKRPEKSLTLPLHQKGGRSFGKVAVRGRGGGAKKLLRIIDFRRNKHNIEAKVVFLEYDPVRSANIALLVYVDGEKRYILAPEGLKTGDRVSAGEAAEVKVGNSLPLAKIPVGIPIHNIELIPGRGGQMVRSAGAAATIMSKEGTYAQVRLPSSEIRKIHLTCYATIGQIGNLDWKNIKLGKAGASRYFGRRPKVRGVAQDPKSHPHGGGEGRSGIGMPSPKSPWGKKTLGKKTRKKKLSDKYIVARRKR